MEPCGKNERKLPPDESPFFLGILVVALVPALLLLVMTPLRLVFLLSLGSLVGLVVLLRFGLGAEGGASRPALLLLLLVVVVVVVALVAIGAREGGAEAML